jgi:hypothetical protein
MSEANQEVPTKVDVPEPKAPEAQATPPTGEPQKDEASKLVEEMIADERTKLVDAIMDTKPTRERAYYEAKTLRDLKDFAEFVTTKKEADQNAPAGKAPMGDAREMIDAAYAKAQLDLRKR